MNIAFGIAGWSYPDWTGSVYPPGVKDKLARMRTSSPSDPKGPFLYSSPISMPKIENTDFLFDVRGADLQHRQPRAQRGDPKTGDPSAFPHGRGPQGDVIRIFNFVRLVHGGLD